MKLLGTLLRSTVMLLLAVVICGTFTIAQLDHNEENILVKNTPKDVGSLLDSGADRMIRVFDKIQLFNFKNAQAFFKAGDDESTWSAVTKFARTTSENSRYINKLTEYFPEDALAAAIKNVDDYDDIAKGTKAVMGSHLNGLDDFHKALPEVERLRLIKKIGKYDELIKQNVWVRANKIETYRGVPIKRLRLENPEDAFKQGLKAHGNDYDLQKHLDEHSNSAFIPTSDFGQIAIDMAKKDFTEGIVYHIDPRGLNGVDVVETFRPRYESGGITKQQFKLLEDEAETAFIDLIDPQDIKGFQRVNIQGKYVGEFVPNPSYGGG